MNTKGHFICMLPPPTRPGHITLGGTALFGRLRFPGEGLICELLAEDALGAGGASASGDRGYALKVPSQKAPLQKAVRVEAARGFALVCHFHDNSKRQALVPPFQLSELKLREVTQPAQGLGSKWKFEQECGLISL